MTILDLVMFVFLVLPVGIILWIGVLLVLRAYREINK